MDKDHVSGLSTQELANFPLDDFFDHYEKGLRKVSDNGLLTVTVIIIPGSLGSRDSLD